MAGGIVLGWAALCGWGENVPSADDTQEEMEIAWLAADILTWSGDKLLDG